MKYFKVFLLLALFIQGNTSKAQSNLTTVEYFLDTDPGYGNGTVITVPASTTDYANQIININPALITDGIHVLYIRSKNTDGSWSHTSRILFNIPENNGVATVAANLTTVEYFLDNDPSYGNGTIITVPANTTDYANQIVNINPALIADGIHTFYIRSKNADGSWSHTSKLLFNKPDNNGVVAVAPNLNKVEYFLDNDPGYGNGITVIVPANTTDYAEQIININPALIAEGLHIFYIRARDNNGVWSHTDKLFIYKPDAVNTAITPIKYAEYFIDTDPGYFNAAQIVINPQTDIANFVLSTNITGLATGNHKFFIRGIDSIGKWSHTDSLAFTIPTALPAPAIIVNSINRLVMCARDTFNIGYQATGTYNTGNLFTAQLSDASGSFASPIIIGSKTATSLVDTIRCKLPSHIIGGTGFLIRVVSTNTAVTGVANAQMLTVRDRPFAQSITGLTEVNGTFTHPHSVPNVATSSYTWLATGGIFTTNSPTNSGTMAWAQPAGTNTVGTLKVIETNQFGCIGDTSSLNINVYRLRINNVPDNLTPCKAFNINIAISMDGAFGAGNIYTAQLSDASGSFTSPVNIGTLTANGSGINQTGNITATIPPNTANGTQYRIRVLSDNPAFIGAINNQPITIIKPDIGADITRSKCIGFTYNLATDFTDAALTYQYFDNSFVTTSNNVNTGIYNVVGTNSNGCKDTVQVTVTNFSKPNLGADLARNKCSGFTYNLATDFTDAALTYQYFDNSFVTISSNVNTGLYNVVGTNSSGCKDTAQVTVTNFAQPNTSAIIAGNNFNVGYSNPFSVTNTTGSSYVWQFTNGTQNFGGNSNSVTATFNVPGIQIITVTETNANGCIGTPINLNVNVLGIAATNVANGFPTCAGGTVSVNYTITGNYNSGNVFSVLLSDATGNFTTATVIGTLSLAGVLNNSTGTIVCSLPNNILAGNAYRTKIVASIPNFEGAINNTNITVNAADNTFTLTNDVILNGDLDLSNPPTASFPCFAGGKIILGNFNLRVNGSISGFDNTHFIVTNGTGYLCIDNAASQNNVFPVANNSSTSNFITINNTGTPDVFCVNLKPQVLLNGTTGSPVNSSVVKNTWNITEGVPGGSNAAITVFWNLADELTGFNRNACYVSHYTGSSYDVQPNTSAVGSNPYSIVRNNINSFSPFVVTSLASVLPLSLLNFSGNIDKDVSALNWQTSSEQNSKNFIVQRSSNNVDFIDIATINAAGFSTSLKSYTYDDDVAKVLGSSFYYRLQLNDADGRFSYSPIVLLKKSGKANSITIHPNPVNTTLNADAYFAKNGIAVVSILTVDGKILLQKTTVVQKGNNNISIDMNTVARGLYFIKIDNEANNYIQKFVKE